MRQPLRVLLFALLSLVVGLSACDSGGSDEEDVDNQFTFTIEPMSSSSAATEQEEEVSGFSFFVDAENPDTGEEVFAVYLSDEESFSEGSATQGLFGWLARNSSQPGTGTYDFHGTSEPTAAEFGGVLWEDIQNTQTAPFYVIEGGTVTFSESTDEKIAGSIDATGRKVTITSSGATEEPVTVTGTFTAEDVDNFVPLSAPNS